jgi:DNA-binding transcriptional LysR family regulator
MFERLFAESGLSLDRLRSLLEVGAAGSIAKAVGGDPVKQSQYSRQIKELENFFQARLVERHGKGVRLTSAGKALARISRFFLLGLSNFQRGCLAEDQSFRIGASATFIEAFLVPLLAQPKTIQAGSGYAVEALGDGEIERRLHDLTLDFGVVGSETLSRPLQLAGLGQCALNLWVPKALHKSEARALRAFKDKRLALVLPTAEMGAEMLESLKGHRVTLSCGSYLEASVALEGQAVATFLPEFLTPPGPGAFLCMRGSEMGIDGLRYALAWNPRLLRLNPHASRRRDFLAESLAGEFSAEPNAKGYYEHRKHH